MITLYSNTWNICIIKFLDLPTISNNYLYISKNLSKYLPNVTFFQMFPEILTIWLTLHAKNLATHLYYLNSSREITPM